MATSRKTQREAASIIRKVLALVKTGDLEAKPGRELAMVRRLEGAVAAMETEENPK